ncbi:hypothetical protein [Actinokineospora sp. HUAS TT18]|uniref:hypothetical protein n=1 Tax=Actinokineospora sp. HUAS TT18 TaxID=3447451 RepID=UPI003F51D702
MTEPSTWGGPAPERTQPRWSWKKTVAATAVALGVAGAGGFAVYAAGGASAATSADRGGPGGPGMGGPNGGGRGLMGALHGEFVVSDGNGGYTTKLTQTGEVTEVSDSAITAKSVDGYTKTYTIDADTVRAAVEAGDTVTVIATPSGDSATADSVSTRGAGGPGMGPGGGNQPPGAPPRQDEDQPPTTS